MARNQNQTANVVVTLDGKQAEKMLEVLKTKSSDLRAELKTLNDQRLTTGLTGQEAQRFDALRKELLETRRVSREVAKQVKDVDDVIRNLSTAPIKAIKDSIKTVEAQMNRLNRSTEQYAQKKEQLKKLRDELDRINGTAGKTTSAFGQIGKTVKRLASYVLVYEGFNKLVDGVKKMYEMNVELSDQLADISKTTGLAGQELADLGNEIMKIDTRTSVEQLNKLAVEAGKLGISAKEDILGFVKAGNIINVALGEDLGDDAIRSLSKLNDILGITKSLGVENALLATGSAINELGQRSTANEAYLVDFANRLGGIASQTNLTIQQVLALGSVSDQLAQTSEVSATALNKFITTLVSKTGQVAKAVGIPLQELQQALDRSTWEGMMMVFEKLSGKGGLAAIAPLMGDLGSDGARLNAVISALTNDTSRLTRELGIANQAFAEGTSVLNEYEKKNNNLAANIEKIGKNIQTWFMGSGIIDFLNVFASKLAKITSASETSMEKFQKQSKNVGYLQKEIVPLLDKIEQLQNPKTKDEQFALSEAMQQVADAIPSAVTWMDKYGKVLGVNTERAREFIETQKAILKTENREAIEDAEKELYKLQEKQIRQQEIIDEIAQKGSFQQSKYVQTSSFGSGKYVVDEVSDAEEIAKQQENLLYLNAKIVETKQRLQQLSGDYLSDIMKEAEKQEKEDQQTSTGEDPKDVLKRQIEAIDLWLQKKKNALMEARQTETDINNENYISQEEYQKAVLSLEMKALEKKLAIAGLEPKEIAEIRGRILEIRQQMADDAVRIEKEIQKILLEADPVAKENQAYEERLRSLNLFGVERETLTAEQLKALELLEEQHNNNLADIDRKNREREKRRAEERYKQEVEASTGMQYDLWDKTRGIGLDQMQQELEVDMSIGNGTENEYYTRQMAIHTMRMQLLQEELDMRKKVGAETGDIYKQMSDLEGDMVQEAATHFNQLAGTYQQYGSQIGEAFGNLIGGQEDALQSLADATIDILFDVLDKMANAWIAELAASSVKNVAKAQMESLSTPDSVLTFGASGIARAAIMSGLITAALAAAKAGIKAAIRGGSGSNADLSSGGSGQRVIKTGYSVGGHTGDGPTLEVAGVVHRGEYVVPKWQMQDPVSFDYVRALETIRQTRTRMNPLPVRHGYAEGGPVSTPVSPTYDDRELKQTLNAMNRLLIKLDRKGVRTEFNISRLNDVQQSYNASRSRGTLKG